MDRNFLEFWGNSLICAAKTQKQLEEMPTNWMGQKLTGFEHLAAIFSGFYRPEPQKKESPQYFEIWKECSEHFVKSFNEYLGLMLPAPKNEHVALMEKYQNLKKKEADQAETIKHLEMLLVAKVADQGKIVMPFSMIS